MCTPFSPLLPMSHPLQLAVIRNEYDFFMRVADQPEHHVACLFAKPRIQNRWQLNVVSASGLTTIVFPQILEIGCWLVGRGVNKRFPILNEWAARHCLSFRAFDFLACRNRSHRNNSHLLPAMMGNVCCLTMSEPLPGETILGNYVSVSLIC